MTRAGPERYGPEGEGPERRAPVSRTRSVKGILVPYSQCGIVPDSEHLGKNNMSIFTH